MSVYRYTKETSTLFIGGCTMALNCYVGLFCENNNIAPKFLPVDIIIKHGINRVIEGIVSEEVTPRLIMFPEGSPEVLADFVDIVCMVIKSEVNILESELPFTGSCPDSFAEKLRSSLCDMKQRRKEWRDEYALP